MTRFHGPEIDRALEAVQDPIAMCERHGICLTGLDTRLTGIIDRQIEEYTRALSDPSVLRDELAAQGVDTAGISDDEMRVLALRSVIGGSFTFGVGTAFELQAEEARRRG